MRTARQTVLGAIACAAIAAGAVVSVASPLGVSPASAAAVDIRLLNINDFHGRIDSNTVKFAGTVEQLKATAPTPANTIFGAAGDLVGASLFASAVQEDNPTIDVLNALKLQTSSVGNHEFDKGFNDLANRIEPRSAWNYLCANCYNAGTTTPAFPEFQVFTVGTVTVGYIGAVTQETPTLVSPTGVSNLSFGDPVAAVTRVANQLSDGIPGNGEAQVIVAEYHEGANNSPTPPAPPATFNGTVSTPQSLAAALGEPTFANIANNTSPNVDVIFTGHTHKAYTYDVQIPGAAAGKTRPIVQTGQYGEYVGVVDLVVDDTSGSVSSAVSALRPRVTTSDNTLTMAYPAVAQVKTIVDAALAKANEIGAAPVAAVTASITTAFSGGTYTGPGNTYTGGTRDDRARESTLGNLVADSILATLEDPALGGAEIAVVNPGGLRAELDFAPDGVVTFGEANSVVPFANTLNTITLTGAQLKTLLEQQWQRDANNVVPSRAYLQLGLSKNFSYTFDPTRPEGDRITSININGAPVDPARGYRVGAFSFLAEGGGDNFRAFLQGTNRRDSGLIDRDAFIAYLTANSPLTPDFARRAVQVSSTFPQTASPGTRLQFTVSQLDLTSLGSPRNTELDVYVGGVRIAIVPVTNGAASVDVVVPELPTGARHVTLVARPSGTTVNPRALNPIPPTRLVDTRGPSQSANAVRTVDVKKIGGEVDILRIKAADIEGLIPALGVTGVSLNVAVDDPEGDGFLTVYDCGTRQLVASVNYRARETVSNQVLAPVSDTGEICVYSLRSTHVIIDVNGWFSEGYVGIEPNRIFDTRPGLSPNALRPGVEKKQIGGDPALEVKVTGLGTNGSLVPGAGVGSVSLNVAVTGSTLGGFVTVYPCGSRSLVASINFAAGETVSNSVIAPVSATGNLCFYSPVPVDVIVDINGWFATSSTIRGVQPTRLFDTRPNEPGSPVVDVQKVKVGPTNPLTVKVTGLAGLVPATGVGAVSLNVAVTNPAAAGFVTVYPCGNRPFTANVNYSLGETTSNGVIVPVSSDGTICFYSLVPTDLVADINNWFAS